MGLGASLYWSKEAGGTALERTRRVDFYFDTH